MLKRWRRAKSLGGWSAKGPNEGVVAFRGVQPGEENTPGRLECGSQYVKGATGKVGTSFSTEAVVTGQGS